MWIVSANMFPSGPYYVGAQEIGRCQVSLRGGGAQAKVGDSQGEASGMPPTSHVSYYSP